MGGCLSIESINIKIKSKIQVALEMYNLFC